ncbi:MAG: sulfite exporter TauE/SafE family protein [Candidatus Kerfeldbacteria bacterium]|nr:sulfite exporter TauE/SafE family protein [Candidatus Kerfeldbacteria bacterium]
MNPITALLIGLSTGGLTCLAVQGGLLMGLLARRQADDQAQSLFRWQRLVLPVSAFLVAKIVVYTLFGLALGLIGEKLQLTTTARIWIQSFAAAFMLLAGIRLIWPHFLPWLNLNPPASVRRFVRRSGKSEAMAAPALLGALTILIPCGTTIAMETAAIATGSAWQAASIMFAFVLGTAPLFFTVGILAKGSTLFQQRLKYATALLVIGIGLYTFNGVLNLTDSPYSMQNELAAWRWAVGGAVATADAAGGASADAQPTIEVTGTGYSPSSVTVPAGQPVTLNMLAKGQLGCTSILRIPKLNVQQQIAADSTTPVTVTFPSPGPYLFTCGMGMFTGTINAV